MKRNKKWISILLCAALLLGLLPTAALADEPAFVPGIHVDSRGMTVSVVGATEVESSNGEYTFNDGAESVTVTITGENYHGIRVRSYGDSQDPNAAEWRWLKLEDGVYTITDLSKFYEIEVIDRQQSVYDNEFVVDYDPSNDFTVKVGSTTLIPRETVTTFDKNVELSFTASAVPYKVLVRTNDAADVILTPNSTAFTYTPTSDAGFELIVYRTAEEYNFDTIPCDWESQFIAEYQVRFDGCDPNEDCTVTYEVEPAEVKSYDGRTRLVLANGTTQVKLTITAAEGYVYEVRVNGQDTPESVGSDNVYTWTVGENSDVRPEIVFRSGGTDPGEGDPGEGGGGNTPRPEDYTGAAAYIEGWDLAYCGANADAIKTSMATELWNEGFCVFNGHTGDYTGMFADLNAFKGAITLSENTATNDSKILGLSYYTYTVMLNDVDGTENDIKAEGKVYVLTDAKQFGVKIGDSEYHLLDTSGLSGENGDLYVQSNSTDISKIKVFGNGVCAAGSLSFGSGNGWGAHITQDHSGLSDGPGCRLAVLPANYTGVKIVSDVTAAAWGFVEVPIFATGSNSSPVAEIFYGNDGTVGRTVTISQIKDSVNPAIGPAITGIAVDTELISGDVATITGTNGTFTVAFNSNYDVIPLTVTYGDGSTGKLTIHRVGLHLADDDVSNGEFKVWHGTDNDTPYSSDAQKVVTAAFYYNTGEEQPAESISLFVTIQTKTGTIHKVVTRLNNDFIATTGNDKWADDFLLWSGTDAEYANLISISAIAYSAGSEDSFGGVKVGSGTGVTWENK